MQSTTTKFRLILLLGSICIVVASISCIFTTYAPHFRHGSWPVGMYPEPSEADYPVRGIDLSHHNGMVDMNAFADKIDFLYLKASEGATWRDPMYNTYYSQAKTAGIPVGAYHFFNFTIDGRLQAENFLWHTHHHSLDLPPVIDVETHTQASQPDRLTVARLTDMINALREAGHDPVIYTHRYGVSRFIDRLDINPKPRLWISSFTDPPLPDSTGWIIWQYSNVGTLPGISGDVDLNAAPSADFILAE
ncbi:MAG: hypothetical protein K2F61_03145 [Muribaculaceae bacterium]|nr:hypothetical protein [Muribaculaceae bacterium]